MILMTYLMALLILVGAALVGLSKFLQWRKQLPYRQKEEQEDIERSTLQFKQELERSGSEIIGRLGEHVERLEALIREADRRADTLDHRLTELHTLSQSLDAQTEELRAAEQEARREQQFVSQLMGELRAAAAGAAAARGAALPAPVERVDADDFTSVLRHSIARDEERRLEGEPRLRLIGRPRRRSSRQRISRRLFIRRKQRTQLRRKGRKVYRTRVQVQHMCARCSSQAGRLQMSPGRPASGAVPSSSCRR